MGQLVLQIALMVIMMMEPWIVRSALLSVWLVLAQKIARNATSLLQAILRTSSKDGVIPHAQTLFILTLPSTVWSVTAIARPVKIRQLTA
jgi:hypothetical protein